jgi:hypothetical protein
MGVWFGWLAWRSGSLWASTWAHAWNNTWAVLYFLVGQAWVVSHPWLVGGSAALGLLAGVALLLRDGAVRVPDAGWEAWARVQARWRKHPPESAADVAVQRLVALRKQRRENASNGLDQEPAEG